MADGPNQQSQPDIGPDGKLYRFPVGTTDVAKNAYYKSKGIGSSAASPTSQGIGGPTGKTTVEALTVGHRLKRAVMVGKEALPAIGSIAAVGLTPETGGASDVVAGLVSALLGGMAGESARQGTAAALDSSDRPQNYRDAIMADLKQGVLQGAYELAGRTGSEMFGRMVGTKGLSPVDKAIQDINDRYRLHMSTAEIRGRGVPQTLQRSAEGSILARARMQASKGATTDAAERAVNDALANLSHPDSSFATGQGMQKALQDANRIFHDQGDALYDALDRASNGVLVNMQYVKDEAERIAKQHLPTASTFPRVAGFTTPEKKVLEDIMNAPDYVPFSVAHNFRSRLLQIAPEPTEMMPSRGPALARHFVGRLTTSMEAAAGNLQGNQAVQTWKTARDFWKEGSQIFNGGLVQKLIDADPSKVVANIKTPSDVQAVKSALLGYGATYGSTAGSKASARAAWDSFRQRYVREVLLGSKGNTQIGLDPLRTLGDNLRNAEPETLKALFSDQRGQEAYSTLHQIGQALERVNAMPGPPELSFWRILRLGGFEEGEALLAQIITHPRAAKVMTRALREAPRSADIAVRLMRKAKEIAQEDEKRQQQEEEQDGSQAR